jgi:hypothetical protein
MTLIVMRFLLVRQCERDRGGSVPADGGMLGEECP